MNNHWELFIDGAARNNPGPAGAGIYLLKNKECIIKRGFYLGELTNNQAEYWALGIGVRFFLKLSKPGDTLTINSDSLLLVKQISGIYKVKSENIIPLYQRIKENLSEINFKIQHIYRDKNKVADSMANYGIDHKINVIYDC